MYHAGKPLAHRTPKKNLFGSAATVRPQVFPNEATAFHPWLPQRSRRARLCAWAARKLPSGAAWRMQMAGVAWNSRTQWTFALRPGRSCNPVDIAIVRTTQRKNVQPWPDLPEYVFLRRMRWTRPCPTYCDSAACHRQCIQDAMLCAGCDGGQHTVDQHTAAGCCAGRMPRIADACSSCGLDTEKCGRRCSSTDASTWQDGLVAILRNALCKDTGRKYRPLFSLLLFSLAKSLTRLEELRDERNLRPKIGSPTPPNCPLTEVRETPAQGEGPGLIT